MLLKMLIVDSNIQDNACIVVEIVAVAASVEAVPFAALVEAIALTSRFLVDAQRLRSSGLCHSN